MNIQTRIEIWDQPSSSLSEQILVRVMLSKVWSGFEWTRFGKYQPAMRKTLPVVHSLPLLGHSKVNNQSTSTCLNFEFIFLNNIDNKIIIAEM